MNILFKLICILALVTALFSSGASLAQEQKITNDGTSNASSPEDINSTGVENDKDPDSATKDTIYQLAEKVLEVRPLDKQVERAIQQITAQMPVQRRERIRMVLRNAIDIEYLEHLSLKVMADVFSRKELETMIDFYSRPEIKTMDAKLGEFNRRISPSISLMVEEAMQELKKIQK